MVDEVYHRWFILPSEERDDGDDEDDTRSSIRPKYSDHDEIVAWSGVTVPPSVAEDYHAAFTQQFPDVDPWYIAKMYGSWDRLNAIHANYQDTNTLADHGQDIKPVLDDMSGVGERSAENWNAAFRTSFDSDSEEA